MLGYRKYIVSVESSHGQLNTDKYVFAGEWEREGEWGKEEGDERDGEGAKEPS